MSYVDPLGGLLGRKNYRQRAHYQVWAGFVEMVSYSLLTQKHVSNTETHFRLVNPNTTNPLAITVDNSILGMLGTVPVMIPLAVVADCAGPA